MTNMSSYRWCFFQNNPTSFTSSLPVFFVFSNPSASLAIRFAGSPSPTYATVRAHTLRLWLLCNLAKCMSMKKPFGEKRHYAKQSMQVETINIVSVEGVSVRGFRGLGVFKGTCFTRSRAYHNLLWWSPHPRHTSAPLGLLLLLAQIEFFWFPEQTKIDTGDFWDAASEGFPQTRRCSLHILTLRPVDVLLHQLSLIILSLSFMC